MLKSGNKSQTVILLMIPQGERVLKKIFFYIILYYEQLY